MVRCWISIGSNIDRERHIRSGVRALREQFGAVVLSPVYEAAAVGFAGDAFYNLVAGIDTSLPVAQLRDTLRRIEDANDRTRGVERFSSRTLDLDLLTCGDLVTTEGRSSLPRDEILKYAFVLGPLNDVAAAERHPVQGQTYGELWQAFPRASQPLRRVELNLD